MSSARGPLEQSSLFDLDLGNPSEPGDLEAPVEERAEDVSEPTVDLDDPSLADTLPQGGPSRQVAEPVENSRSAALYAAWTDGALHLGVVLAVVVGLRLLGVALDPSSLPGVFVLLTIFSLFYFVIPLAFWGRTLGLAAVGLVVRDLDGGPLTLGGAWRRWLASCLTVLLCGLPWLLLLTGRSLADRLSSSTTEARSKLADFPDDLAGD